jgi:uncharacterized protein YecT (DUF1311 family)
MRLSVLLFVLLAAAGFSGPVAAQSGDCAHATTQLQMNRCASQSLRDAQAQLTVAYDRIAKRLKGDPAKTKLFVAAETAWANFRDAECKFGSSASAGGSIYPTILNTCLQRLTAARVKDLNAYATCPEYDSSCPVPAK